MTNIKDLHPSDKVVSALPLFKQQEYSVIALHISAGEQLKEHISKTPALLICISGEAGFGNENGVKEKLICGDYIKIEPTVKHWVDGVTDCELILVK
jgi:quercetin dioxygenase-like cupin family protein